MNNAAVFCKKSGYILATLKRGGGHHYFIRSILLSITAHKKIFTMVKLGENSKKTQGLDDALRRWLGTADLPPKAAVSQFLTMPCGGGWVGR